MPVIDHLKLPGSNSSYELNDARISQIESTVNNNANPVTSQAVKAVTDKRVAIQNSGIISGSRVNNLHGIYGYADGLIESDHDIVYGIHGTTAASDDNLPDTQKLVTKDYVDGAISALTTAMTFIGTTTTPISEGSTQSQIVIDGVTVTAVAGNLVMYQGVEYIFNGTTWYTFFDPTSLSVTKDNFVKTVTPTMKYLKGVDVTPISSVGAASTWAFQMGSGAEATTLIITGGNGTAPTAGSAIRCATALLTADATDPYKGDALVASMSSTSGQAVTAIS